MPSHALPPLRKGGPCAARRHEAHAAPARVTADCIRSAPEHKAGARGEGSVTSVCNSNMWKLEIDCLLMPRNSNLLVRVFASSPI